MLSAKFTKDISAHKSAAAAAGGGGRGATAATDAAPLPNAPTAAAPTRQKDAPAEASAGSSSSIRSSIAVGLEDGIDGSVVYSFDESTATHLSKQPLAQDPYQATCVYVSKSNIRGAGDGLFAKRDLPAGRAVCYYAGLRMSSDEASAGGIVAWG